MPQNGFTWNPKGLRKLSFKDFEAFPISPQKQIVAAIVCTFIVILGSAVRLRLPINTNFLVYALIGYFMVERVHPHPLVGPATVTVGVIGLLWTVVMLVPDSFWFPGAFMLVLAMNVFLGLAAGAILAAITKSDKEC